MRLDNDSDKRAIRIKITLDKGGRGMAWAGLTTRTAGVKTRVQRGTRGLSKSYGRYAPRTVKAEFRAEGSLKDNFAGPGVVALRTRSFHERGASFSLFYDFDFIGQLTAPRYNFRGSDFRAIKETVLYSRVPFARHCRRRHPRWIYVGPRGRVVVACVVDSKRR